MERSPYASYLNRHSLRITGPLGNGKDGDIEKTDRNSAIKKFKTEQLYRRELRAYQLLMELSIDHIEGFKLPRLIDFDDEGWLIEMTIVSPPFFLDFASTHDEMEIEHLTFSDEIWAERESHWADIFGEQWPIIRAARDTLLQLTGLMHLDLSINNIRLR